MEKTNKATHLVVTELDCAKECNFKVQVCREDILYDIKFFMREYYVATFMADGDGLKLTFNNGQSFQLSVTEILN